MSMMVGVSLPEQWIFASCREFPEDFTLFNPLDSKWTLSETVAVATWSSLCRCPHLR